MAGELSEQVIPLDYETIWGVPDRPVADDPCVRCPLFDHQRFNCGNAPFYCESFWQKMEADLL